MLTNSIHKAASRYLALEPVLKSLVDDDSAWERVAEEQDECLTSIVYTPAVCVSGLIAKQYVWEAYKNYAVPGNDLLAESIEKDRVRLGLLLTMAATCVAQ